MSRKAGTIPKAHGRPTLKSEERIEKIAELAAQGKTDKQIADIVGISERTITNWKAKDWQFSAVLKENKQLADDLVEASLFKSAVGYEHRMLKEVATKEGVQTIEDASYHPPNATSMIFWLKNRQPKKWKDRVEIQTDSKETLMVVSNGNKLPIKR